MRSRFHFAPKQSWRLHPFQRPGNASQLSDDRKAELERRTQGRGVGWFLAFEKKDNKGDPQKSVMSNSLSKPELRASQTLRFSNTHEPATC